MKTKLPTAQPHDQRLDIVLPAELKRSVFEIAAKRGQPTSSIVREALQSFTKHAA